MGNTITDKDLIQNRIDKILKREQLISLKEEEFDTIDDRIMLITETYPISRWNIASDIKDITNKAVVNITGGDLLSLSAIEEVVQSVDAQFDKTITIIYGASRIDELDIRVDVFLIR